MRREISDMKASVAATGAATNTILILLNQQKESQDEIKKTVKSTNRAVKSQQSANETSKPSK